MERAGREYQILQTAIAALQATVGLKTVKVDAPLAIADAVLTIALNGHSNSSSRGDCMNLSSSKPAC